MKGYIVLVAAASAIVGAAVGVSIVKFVDAKRYKKDLDAVKDTMAAVKEKRSKKVRVLPEASEEPSADEGVGASVQEEDSEEEEEQGEAQEYKDLLGPYRPSKDHPYMIKEEEFNANDGRNKRSVFYYEGDDTAQFADDGSPLNVEEDLGKSNGNLDEDRFLDASDGLVYIRNNRKSEDYAVDMYPGSSDIRE